MSSGPTYVRITADVTDLQAKLALAKAEFSSSNSELRSMAQQMREAGSAANDNMKASLLQAAEATAKARQEMNALNRELRETSGATSGGLKDFITFGESGIHIKIREMAEAFSTLGVAIAAAFAGREITEWASSVAESGAKIQHLSQETGLSVEQVSSLAGAARAMGVSVDEAAEMIDRLEKNMALAQNPTSKQAAAFAALGISAKDLKGLSIDQVMAKIADAFHDSADGPDKTAIAMELMGRAGAQMIPLLDQGSGGLAKFKEMAERTGTVLTGPMSEGMERTVIGITGLKMAAQGVGISLFELFKPAIDAVVTGLTDMIVAINDSIRTGGIMADVVKVAVAGFNALVLAITTARIAVEEFYMAGVTAYKAIADAMHGDFGKAQKDIMAGYADMKKAALDYFNTAYNLVTNTGSDLGAKGDGKGEKKKKLDSSGIAGGQAKEKTDYYAQWKEELQQQLLDLQLFGKDAENYELEYWQAKLREAQAGGKNYVSAVREITGAIYGIESEEHRQALEDEKRAAEEKKRATDQSYRDFKASIDEQREAYATNIQERIALDQLLVEKAKELYGQDSANFKEAVKQKLADMKTQIDQQMAPIKKAADMIGNTFDQMFKGMLEGSQTFAQSMRQLMLRLIEDFAAMAIKNTENWVVNQVRQTMETEQSQDAQVAAVVAGQAAQNAAKAAGQAQGKAADAALGSASVFADANKAAAGAYAAVVDIPVVGPVLAPVAAVTAYGAVMAYDVFSAEGGFDIPAGVEPITQLHQQEMVLPANLAERVRNMTDPGQQQQYAPAPIYNLNISTMDSQSFVNNIAQVKHAVASIMVGHIRDNPSLSRILATGGRF